MSATELAAHDQGPGFESRVERSRAQYQDDGTAMRRDGNGATVLVCVCVCVLLTVALRPLGSVTYTFHIEL